MVGYDGTIITEQQGKGKRKTRQQKGIDKRGDHAGRSETANDRGVGARHLPDAPRAADQREDRSVPEPSGHGPRRGRGTANNRPGSILKKKKMPAHRGAASG